jgi:hypothetical protein
VSGSDVGPCFGVIRTMNPCGIAMAEPRLISSQRRQILRHGWQRDPFGMLDTDPTLDDTLHATTRLRILRFFRILLMLCVFFRCSSSPDHPPSLHLSLSPLVSSTSHPYERRGLASFDQIMFCQRQRDK